MIINVPLQVSSPSANTYAILLWKDLSHVEISQGLFGTDLKETL